MASPRASSILIVRLSAIGDVIHTLPCLRALRRAFPDARLGWIVEELSAPLLEGCPDLDLLYVIPKKHWRKNKLATFLNGESRAFYKKIRDEGWDVALDPQGLTKSGLAAWRSGAPRRVGFAGADSREFNRLFMTERVAPPDSAGHVIERNLSLLGALGVSVSPNEVEWRFPDFERERGELSPFWAELPHARDAKPRPGSFIGLYPGAGWVTKRWPPERFAELARLLDQAGRERGRPLPPMVLIWGPSERGLCEDIIRQSALPESALRLAPATTLRQLAALLGESALLVAGDTGPMHLAAALGRPVVAVYGASDGERNGPWGEGHVVLRAENADCAPCWKTECREGGLCRCMTDIRPERVAEAVLRLLERGDADPSRPVSVA